MHRCAGRGSIGSSKHNGALLLAQRATETQKNWSISVDFQVHYTGDVVVRVRAVVAKNKLFGLNALFIKKV